jgi:hypothetical protein
MSLSSARGGSWQLKYLRAREHLEQLRADHEWFIKGGPAAFTSQLDVETGEYVSQISRLDRLPAKWPALVGDCLQNLRASLNHLTWELDTRKPADRDESVEFPIFWKPPKANAWAKRTGSLPTAVETAIKGFQPYCRGQANPTGDPLWWLHELARIDRHRYLHFAVWRLEGSGIIGREGVQSFPARALKVGARPVRRWAPKPEATKVKLTESAAPVPRIDTVPTNHSD